MGKCAMKKNPAQGKILDKGKILVKGKLFEKSKMALKANVKTKALGKKDLEKLGKVSLKEKIAALAAESKDELELRDKLKTGLTGAQKSQVWNEHKKHLDENAEEAAQHNALSKKEKGSAAALWFIKQNKPKFLSLTLSMEGKDTVTVNDQWVSEKQVHDKFGLEEMQRHLNSGRLLWREDPWTKGVWQYKDQGDFHRQKTVSRGKSLAYAQETAPPDEEVDWFSELFDQDICLCL